MDYFALKDTTNSKSDWEITVSLKKPTSFKVINHIHWTQLALEKKIV